jgi:acetolactate synthase I/II/III large subunit
MKASDYIIDFFASKGVDTIFGYIGGMIVHLVDSVDKNNKVRFIQTYHEQSAAIAAEGYALTKGTIGVAMATSGPGFTNMITGIADAYFGSVPVIYISGQVNSYEYKYDKPIRQQGFQETDAVSIATPITKYAKLLDNESDIAYELEKAYYIANEGRKGPVLLDIPMNIQRAEIDINNLKHFTPPNKAINKISDLKPIVKLLEGAKHPMVLLGAGCVNNEVNKILYQFIKNSNFPFVYSLMGKGVINEDKSLCLGMIGSYGNRCANIAMDKVDVLLVLGSRLDLRQTGNYKLFLPNSYVIQVNNDKNELDYNRIGNREKVQMDVLDFLKQIEELRPHYNKNSEWHKYLKEIKSKYNQEEEIRNYVDNKSPYLFVEWLNKITKNGDIITSDIGQNQMWVAQTLKMKQEQMYLTSGNFAPMGYSLPSAVGAAFAKSKATIYSINGDGGFHIAVQSLLLISQYKLPIKIIIINNESLGMITQFQYQYFDGNLVATSANGGYMEPDIESIAKAYRLPYLKLSATDLDDESTISEIENMKNGIIDYYTKGLTTVCPKLPFDHSMADMIPKLKA